MIVNVEIKIRQLLVKIINLIISLIKINPSKQNKNFIRKLYLYQKKINIKLFDDDDYLLYLYRKKYNLENNLKSIKILIIGSSHSDYGFYSPVYADSFNLGLTSGDLYTSFHLYENYKSKLQSLNYIILFYSVFSAGYSLISTSERYRSVAYKYFFNVPYQVPKLIKRRFEKKILNKCKNLKLSDANSNFYGYERKTEFLIYQSANERAKSHLRENMREPDQLEWLIKLISSINKDDKEILIVIPPFRNDYKDLLPQSSIVFDKLFRLGHYMKYDILNFYDSEFFIDNDFGDADHLNEQGAIKLTKMINEYFLKKNSSMN